MTALDIIKRALRLIGVIAKNEPADAADAADGLSALNSLVQSFGNEPLLIFSPTTQNIAIPAGQSSFTIGPTGATVAARPIRVLNTSYVVLNGVSYQLEQLTDWDYAQLTLKDLQTGIPCAMYVDNSMPDTLIRLYPIPSIDMTLVLATNSRISNFPTLTTEVVLPDGYDRMLAYCLAVDIAPEYDRDPKQDVKRIAAVSKKALKRTNTQIPRLDMPAGIPNGWRGGIVNGGRAGADAIVSTDGQFIVYTP